MMRAVSVLTVNDPRLFEQLVVDWDLPRHLAFQLSETEWIAKPSFDKEVLPKLQGQVLVRYARRSARTHQLRQDALQQAIDRLPRRAREVLHSAQRHAHEGVVLGLHAWDPAEDGPHVRALHGAGLLVSLDDDALPYAGRYRLAEDLPPPPAVPLDFAEACMEETDDLSPPNPGPASILHDAAGLAAAIDHVVPRRTHKGPLSKSDVKKLGKRLGARDLQDGAAVSTHPRWGLALRALEALGAVSVDPMTRELHLDLGLDETLSGATTDAINRFVHKVVERDLHPLIPALREALHQAGDGALDEVILSDLLREQYRDILFVCWRRDVGDLYPMLPGELPRLYTDDAWDGTEGKALDRALRRLERIGLVRRAPGVVAATADGRAWANSIDGPHPPIWVSSDLEIIVPPNAVTAWERFQLERLGVCLSRDVTDRYRIERKGLRKWLQTHELDEALLLLERRAPGIPPNVVDTLKAWDAAARRLTLTRGVLLEDEPEKDDPSESGGELVEGVFGPAR